MRIGILAVAVAAGLVLARPAARADEGAYGSLVGMADSAAHDSGPDDGDIPPDAAARSNRDAARPAPRGAAAPDAPLASASPAPSVAPAAPTPSSAPVDASSLKDALAEPPGPAARRAGPPPRPWTRLYSTLMPSWRKVPALKSGYDAPASTAPARAAARPAAPASIDPDSEAIKAGERRGLAELLSVSVPVDPQ